MEQDLWAAGDSFPETSTSAEGSAMYRTRWQSVAAFVTLAGFAAGGVPPVAQEPKVDETRLREVIAQADEVIRLSKGKQDASAEPYLTKGTALIRLKQPEQALATLLEGAAVLQKSPKAPGQPNPSRFIEALALVQAQRDPKATAQPAAVKKVLDDLKTQNKALAEKVQAGETALAEAEKALAAEQAKRKAAEVALDQAKKEAEQAKKNALLPSIKEMENALAQERKEKRNLIDEANNQRRESIRARVEARTLERANDQLEDQVKDLNKMLAARSVELGVVAKELAAAREHLARVERQLADTSVPAVLGGQARFLIEVPAPDARLYVDDKLYTPSDKVMREFVTPKLQGGRRYLYTLRVEFERDGKPATATKKVTFRPDTEQRVSFRGRESGK